MTRKELAEQRVRWQAVCEALREGHCEVLTDESNHEGIVNSLTSHLKSGELSLLGSLLEGIVICCCHGDERIRRHGMEILFRFLRLGRIKKLSTDHLGLVAQSFSGWLRGGLNFLPDSEEFFSLLYLLIERLAFHRLWRGIELILQSAHRSVPPTIDSHMESEDNSFPCFSTEAGRRIIALLVAAFAKAKTGDRQQIKGILQIFGDAAILPLIDELFKHPDKEVRIALFGVIPRKTNIIVPTILRRLASKQPWFILRNAILLLALLDDAGLFCLVKPFLKHPDHRVQKAVIDFIALVGSDEVRSDLIEAILVVDDRLLPGLVLLLQQHGGEEVEMAFLSLLSDRHQIVAKVRDELVIRLCESGMLPNSQKSRDILYQIVIEEQYGGSSESQVALVAEKALRQIEKGGQVG